MLQKFIKKFFLKSFSQLTFFVRIRSLMIVIGEKSLLPQGKFKRPECLAPSATLFHLRISACDVSACVQWLSGVQLFPTLWTVARQALVSKEFSRQEYWSGLPFPTPGIFATQGLNPSSPVSPALAGGESSPLSHWEAS